LKALLHFVILAALAGVTVVAVRLLILRGLDIISTCLNLGTKTKGQLLGYATSIPELVVVISAAWAGVFEAGFWNIASSNIINWVLFLAAVLFYRQHWDLRSRKFADELVFGLVSVAVPLMLYSFKAGTTTWTALGLFGLFVVYKVLDRVLNPKAGGQARTGVTCPRRGPLVGVLLVAAGIVTISICGTFLGTVADSLVRELKTPAWLVGWLLGLVTSVPEMGGFFMVFRSHRERGTSELTDDTQEALDALVASNMCNLGIILPCGVLLFWLVTRSGS
jgi:cation:H+ antiporter